MTDTVTIALRDGVDSNGDPSFAAQTTIKCRVERKQKLIRTASGDEWMASHVIASTDTIPMGTQVWLPDTDTNETNDSLRPKLIKSAASISGGGTLYETWL